jgi:hypothetical protein
LATDTPQAARVCGVKVKRQRIPDYSLNALDAAVRVLKEAKKPLTCQEIVDRAIKRKFWRTEGATPQNSLNAALARDIKANGEKSRFIKTGRGLFSAR